MLESQVRAALQQAHIRPSRARGQHFLIDDGVLASIVQAAELTGKECIVEIGPGLGTLTQSLAARSWRVHAFELDDQICRFLQGFVLPGKHNIVLHDVAFNKFVFEPVIAEAQAAARPLKIVTNLPYQISSAFLHTVADYSADIALTVVMLQREVAQRLVARPGDPGYGSFSLYMQGALNIEWVCDVPRQCFHPEPRVDSAVVSLRPLTAGAAMQARDPERCAKLIQAVFRRRRKQMVNALREALPHLSADSALAALQGSSIDPHCRPEELSRQDFIRLSDRVYG